MDARKVRTVPKSGQIECERGEGEKRGSARMAMLIKPTNHGYPFLPVLREELISILATNLENPGSLIKTSAHVVDIMPDATGAKVWLDDGTYVTGSIAIGADGVHSKTSGLMQKLIQLEDETARVVGELNNPIVPSFHSIFGRASNKQLKFNAYVFFESRGSGSMIQCTVDEENL